MFNLRIVNPIKEYKEYKSKLDLASKLSDTYFGYSKYILEEFNESNNFYRKYYHDYNRIFQYNIYYLGDDNQIDWLKNIEEYKEKIEEIEETFLELPLFKEINRRKNLNILLE